MSVHNSSTSPRGLAVLRDPLLNKGTAFTAKEREALGLRGLLPPHVLSQAEQAQRFLANLRRLTDPLDDPESYYLTPEQWEGMSPFMRLLWRFDQTLLGRVTVGAPMHILIIPGVTMPTVEDSLLARIRETAGPGVRITVAKSAAEATAAMEDVEVILGTITPEMFARAKKLTWVHAITSGADSYLFPEMVESEVMLSGDKGLVGSHLADHTFALLLSLTRRLARAVQDAPHSWKNRVAYRAEEFELEGCTMGVVGFGETAQELAIEEIPGLTIDYNYGTNLQHALMLAGRFLDRHRDAEPRCPARARAGLPRECAAHAGVGAGLRGRCRRAGTRARLRTRGAHGARAVRGGRTLQSHVPARGPRQAQSHRRRTVRRWRCRSGRAGR